jgi:ribonuclease VapC
MVLDASAILAFINKEPGGDVVAAVIDKGRLSAVNLAEVISKLVEKGWTPEGATMLTDTLYCEVVPADRQNAVRAGVLHQATRGKNVSLADRFCLALGQQLDMPVLTGDRAWTSLGLDVDVQLIR